MVERIPLPQEPITDPEAVAQYDRGARLYILPEYKYFVRKVILRGFRTGRVLDIGTGSGRLAIELARAKGSDFEIIGLDISRDMLLKAQDNARQAGVDDKIKFVLGTAARLPFADGSFDLIISYASLHHWFEPAKVFNEAQRVAREGGLILIRDNQRVYGNRLWEAFIWAISRFMNRRHRHNWPKAILASYTLAEIEAILQESKLKNYRVKADFIKFDVCIESPVRK
ncbi:MAG: transcriptional regulator, MarR family [Chloroflexi bacterium]|nr:transcriptional regulator, MarR family [Chloroflexota bacterium]